MTNRDEVDKDLREYLAKADNLRNADKLNYLRALFDKHFTFTQLDHVVTRQDLFGIVSNAKSNFSTQPARPYITGKQIEHGEVVAVSVIDSFIGYLNRNHLLKKQVHFDYTDPTVEYDTLEE